MYNSRHYEIIHKMITVSKMHKKAIDTAVDNIGVQRSKHRILMMLSQSDHTASQKEIAEKLDVSSAAVTVSLTALERDGLITRNSGADSRYKEISVTEKGKAIVEVTQNHFINVDKITFEGLSEQDLCALEKCFDKMLDNLKKGSEEE